MRIRIVKTGKDEDSYMVQRKYWFFWLVTGGSDHAPGDCGLTLDEAKKVVREMGYKKQIILEVTI